MQSARLIRAQSFRTSPRKAPHWLRLFPRPRLRRWPRRPRHRPLVVLVAFPFLLKLMPRDQCHRAVIDPRVRGCCWRFCWRRHHPRRLPLRLWLRWLPRFPRQHRQGSQRRWLHRRHRSLRRQCQHHLLRNCPIHRTPCIRRQLRRHRPRLDLHGSKQRVAPSGRSRHWPTPSTA